MMASKVHDSARWFSLISLSLGASKGIAFSRLAASSNSLSDANRNSAFGSTNRRVSHGQATRSTLTSLRVIHFIAPRFKEWSDKAPQLPPCLGAAVRRQRCLAVPSQSAPCRFRGLLFGRISRRKDQRRESSLR